MKGGFEVGAFESTNGSLTLFNKDMAMDLGMVLVGSGLISRTLATFLAVLGVAGRSPL